MLLCFGNKFQERLVLIHRRKYLVEYFGALAELLFGEGLVDLLAGGGELEELLLVAVVLVVGAAVVLALPQPIPAVAQGLDVGGEGMLHPPPPDLAEQLKLFQQPSHFRNHIKPRQFAKKKMYL